MLNLPLRFDDKFADHVRDATGKIIARCQDAPAAAAIVERCNGFAEVLSQLEHLTVFVENLPHQGSAEGPTAYMISESKKVLSKARGQA